MNASNEKNSAVSRAERLKKIRNLANLTRDEICSVDYLNVNTYRGWEISRHGGLSRKGATLIVKRLSEKGVICSVEWLLNGEGSPPYIIPEATPISNTSEEQNILREIMLFSSVHKNAIFTRIEDSGLDPNFKIGDYVAGIKLTGKDIDNAIDKVCIIQTEDGKLFTRLLKKDPKTTKYFFLCTNLKMEKILEYDLFIASVAPIIRHYRGKTFSAPSL